MNDDERVQLAYQLALGRPATPSEVDRANRYLVEFEAATRETLAATATVAGSSASNASQNNDPCKSTTVAGQGATTTLFRHGRFCESRQKKIGKGFGRRRGN